MTFFVPSLHIFEKRMTKYEHHDENNVQTICSFCIMTGILILLFVLNSRIITLYILILLFSTNSQKGIPVRIQNMCEITDVVLWRSFKSKSNKIYLLSGTSYSSAPMTCHGDSPRNRLVNWPRDVTLHTHAPSMG